MKRFGLLFARCYPPTQAALKEHGKVAVIQAGHVMETIKYCLTAIVSSFKLGMVKAEQCLDFKMD